MLLEERNIWIIHSSLFTYKMFFTICFTLSWADTVKKWMFFTPAA